MAGYDMKETHGTLITLKTATASREPYPDSVSGIFADHLIWWAGTMKTCEICGKPLTAADTAIVVDGTGWSATTCTDCADLMAHHVDAIYINIDGRLCTEAIAEITQQQNTIPPHVVGRMLYLVYDLVDTWGSPIAEGEVIDSLEITEWLRETMPVAESTLEALDIPLPR